MDRVDRASRRIEARPAEVYRALVDPALLVRWLPPPGARARIDRFEARPGGPFEITLSFDAATGAEGKSGPGTDVVKGRFLELEPGRRIVQSFSFESPDPAYAGAMVMRWLLEADGDSTLLSVTAEQVPSGIPADVHEQAMAASLEQLEALIAG
jgi:uncharacterized protein YndB with AHSA1/START domain